MADIGATMTRCALVGEKGQELAPETFENADFTGVEGVLRVYLDHRRASDRPSRAALAVAAPIVGDEVQMINIGWRFSQSQLQQALDLKRLQIVNDFAANAWALPQLEPADIAPIGGGESAPRTTLAVLGPGSGLGVAGLVPTGDGWAVMTGEGGHVSMPAATREEQDVIALLRDRFDGHCSAERVLSGPGLVNLYVALAELAGRGHPTVNPEDVTNLARQGEPLARKTLAMFFAMLGTVAANLALTAGARGGIYIAGGIVPRFVEQLRKSEFRARFENKGRYRSYLAAIPTHVITAPLPAFRGLKYLLGYR
ncbi:MAG TPA: glucokinase [Gammaproteobacteria bacterium]|nr:glucokinase [Gammaproteobacteria bacterium]